MTPIDLTPAVDASHPVINANLGMYDTASAPSERPQMVPFQTYREGMRYPRPLNQQQRTKFNQEIGGDAP